MNKTNKCFPAHLFSMLLLMVCINAVNAQTKATSKSFIPTRIEEDFDINTSLSNPAWERAEPIYIKYEALPDPAAPAPVKTKVKVLYSSNNLYIAFIAEDPKPEKMRAQMVDREQIMDNDLVGVYIDTFGNNRQAIVLFANPLGIQMDHFRSMNSESMSFDMVWYSKGTITDSGYIVTMKIPFDSFSFPKKRIQDWNIQFFRTYPRNARHQMYWTNVSIDDPCFLCQSGKMMNIKDIEGAGTLELLPYLLGYNTSTLRNPNQLSSGLDSKPVQLRIGGGISYAINSTTSLNAVINPDFSQIETDAAQIAINQSFALFDPERRPFFTRDANLFETSENLFYSRTINNPLGAVKISHESDNYNIGLITAYDENTPFIIPGQFESAYVASSLNSMVNVLRGKYNFGAESHIGGLITTRNQVEGANYIGSIDWNYKLANNYYFEGQLGYSYSDEINDTTLYNDPRVFGQSSYDAALNGEQYGGSLMSAGLNREAKYYDVSLSYKSYSPTFQSQAGFINGTNRRIISAEQSISYYPTTKWLSRGGIGVAANWEYDFTGQFMGRSIMTQLTNWFAGQTHLSIGYFPLNDERFRGSYFTGLHRFTFSIDSNPIKELVLGANMDIGRYIFRTNSPMSGEGYNIQSFLTLRPISALQLDFSYRYSTLSSLSGTEFYSGNIMRLTTKYNFSRELSLRLITQYNSFSEQLQIYPLLNYKLNPFTKFYIGMNDYLNQLPDAEGLSGFRQVNRQFFVKFQYLMQR